eukprot:UN31793
MKRIFDTADKDKSGTLSIGELAKAMMNEQKDDIEKVLGKNFLYMFHIMDKDNSRSIDFIEFKRWVRTIRAEAEERKTEKMVRGFLMKVYRRLDTDSSNAVTLKELSDGLKKEDVAMDVRKCLGSTFIECMGAIDYNADNKVTFPEFQDWVEIIFVQQQKLVVKAEKQKKAAAAAEKKKKKRKVISLGGRKKKSGK